MFVPEAMILIEEFIHVSEQFYTIRIAELNYIV